MGKSQPAHFADALQKVRAYRHRAARWQTVTPDPNSALALALRAESLRAAWRPHITDRIAFIEDRCRGQRVLDIGCVDHDVTRMGTPAWLHGRLAAVADRCLGVDVQEDGVSRMRQLGYNALVHDFGAGIGPLVSEGTFDVIVAGEFIEHIEQLDVLFRLAERVLAPEGQMIVTTPNPYAPHRVRAARRGVVWENVDHVIYAFPSGMAELSERHDLQLLEAATVSGATRSAPRDWIGAVKRRLQGTQWTQLGFTSLGYRKVARVDRGIVDHALSRLRRPRPMFTGETFLYVVGRPEGRTGV